MVVNSQNALQAELAAMQQIAVALSQLDESTCARVLQWAEQRFQSGVAAVPPAVARAVPRLVEALASPADPGTPADETLSVSALDHFFGPKESEAVAAQAAGAPAQPVIGMLHDFVAEFQSVVREWNVTCDASTDGTETQRVSNAA